MKNLLLLATGGTSSMRKGEGVRDFMNRDLSGELRGGE